MSNLLWTRLEQVQLYFQTVCGNMMQELELKTQRVNLNSLIPRPSPSPVFDHLLCAKACSKAIPI